MSVLLLAVAYRPLRRATFALQSAVVASPMRLGAFVAVLFLVPIGLLVVR